MESNRSYRFEPKLNWSSARDNLIEDFYRPVLKDATLYQRKSGYFSSTSFVGITREIIELIESGGRIQLITSPNFSTGDKNILVKSVNNKEEIIADAFLNDLYNDVNGTKENFVKLMAYMLVNEIQGHPQLEIKIAVPNEGSGLFHQKLGIIHYTGLQKISFSGSVNETASGWSKNIENFKAFCNWKDETNQEVVLYDTMEFDKIWNGEESGIRLYDIPTAVREKILKVCPKSDFEYQEVIKKIKEDIGYKEKRVNNSGGLRDYQIEAITEWVKNRHRGLFAMATGTGKTFTALGCINRFQRSKDRTITVIACPQTHLVDQWKREVIEYNNLVSGTECVLMEREIVCYSDNHKWRNEFEYMMGDFNEELLSGKYIVQHVVVFVTHNTLNTNDFKNKILKITNAEKLIIVDEVHNIGSELSLPALLEEYNGRLGLSATPLRHYDHEGTSALKKYFEKIVFDLPLKEAINKEYLCKYEYHPFYIELTSEEMEKYNEISVKIAMKYGSKKLNINSKPDDYKAEINRSNLVANAQNKLEVLKKIIDLIPRMEQTLIYCTSNHSPAFFDEPTQLEKVKKLLNERHIVSTSITYENPTKDRATILNNLSRGHYDCITAVKCLDEGVDIPSVETAIIMASSGNPKQYIQRRGRVLRQSKKTGKVKALIYDILVKPPLPHPDLAISLRDRKLVARELLRHKDFASIALNKKDAIKKIVDATKMYNIDFDRLDPQYIENME